LNAIWSSLICVLLLLNTLTVALHVELAQVRPSSPQVRLHGLPGPARIESESVEANTAVANSTTLVATHQLRTPRPERCLGDSRAVVHAQPSDHIRSIAIGARPVAVWGRNGFVSGLITPGTLDHQRQKEERCARAASSSRALGQAEPSRATLKPASLTTRSSSSSSASPTFSRPSRSSVNAAGYQPFGGQIGRASCRERV